MAHVFGVRTIFNRLLGMETVRIELALVPCRHDGRGRGGREAPVKEQRQRVRKECNLRSLLSGETLVDDLGVRIDAKVIYGLLVRAGGGYTVGTTSSLVQKLARRPQLSCDSLHCDQGRNERGVTQTRR